MVVDNGAPVSLAGKLWIEKYLEQQDLELQNLKGRSCYQQFKFGPSTKYLSELIVDVPIYVIDTEGKKDVLYVRLCIEC